MAIFSPGCGKLLSVLISFSQINFRNLKTPKLDFDNGVTAIVGQNASGKTNILEAIYLGYTGEILAGRIDNLIKHNEQEAYVSLLIRSELANQKIEIGLALGHKTIKVDSQTIRAAELAKEFAAVLIRPEDAGLIHGSPSKRRRFLDSLLSRLSLRYALLLKEYNRVVDQRNAALKNRADESLPIWTQKFLELGSEIMSLRERAIKRIAEIAQETYSEVANDGKGLSLALKSQGKSLAQLFRESQAEEEYRAITLVGPHRDDMVIFIDNYSVQTFGSRGEARTGALALKVAEYQLLKEKHGFAPLLLLDDFSAELDLNRRAFMLNLAANTPQAIVTGTESPPQYDQLYQVAGGVVGG